MFKSSKGLLAMSVLVLTALAVMLYGCYNQAQSPSQVKPEAKSSLAAPADANAPAGKTAVKKECKAEKKVCPKKVVKKACPTKAAKKDSVDKKKKCHAADANAPDVNTPSKQGR